MFSRQVIFIAVVAATFIFCKTYAQNNATDTTTAQATSNTVGLYMQNQRTNLQLYNGKEYVFLYRKVTGFPFFLVNTFEENSILYDGVVYQNIPLAYDIVSDEVITKTPDNNYLQLIPEKINSFTVGDHLFTRITPADAANTPLTPGFYSINANAAATLLVKYTKVIVHASRPDDPDHFNEYNSYFIKLGSTYYAVKNSSALPNILHDKSNEIKAFLRQDKLSFKDNPEQTLLSTIAYYAQLKK